VCALANQVSERKKESRMDWLTSLWLPILVSAAFVFVASSVIWMALPIHKKDYKKLGDKEPVLLGSLRAANLSPGLYMFPGCDPKTMKNDPAAIERFKAGPWGVLTMMPKPWNMGQMLGLWLLNCLIISALVAYVTGNALPAGTEYLKVFRIAGATAFLAYCGSAMCDSIWKGRPWSQLPGALFDGIVYALVTAGVFGWLWPEATLGDVMPRA
jgi:hypothetical protein